MGGVGTLGNFGGVAVHTAHAYQREEIDVEEEINCQLKEEGREGEG